MRILRTHFVLLCLLLFPTSLFAATLRLTPDTGVYVHGNTFTAQVLLNTQGKPINAADAELSFNPRELNVVSVAKGSLFTLWTLEPTFSNSAGTVSFGGGSPQGYTGTAGSIVTITFRSLGAGAPKVTFKSGSVLAADGLGTNVLTAMNGGTYTIEAKTSAPPPEYVPAVNTPDAPRVTSTTHPDSSLWYRDTKALVSWNNPSDVTQVRTLLDQNPNSVPTKVFESPISERSLEDLPQGVSYFHVQLRNNEGWGRVAHFPLRIDTEEPSELTIVDVTAEPENPRRTFLFTVVDASPIREYQVQIDGKDVAPLTNPEGEARYTTDVLEPGTHSIVVRAIDSAGNSRVATESFVVTALTAPIFTDIPTRLTDGFIPVFEGTGIPGTEVIGTLSHADGEGESMTSMVGDDGTFRLIPDRPLKAGVYTLSAHTEREGGARSGESDQVRIVVEVPGYITLGTRAIAALSVIVPLIALTLLLTFGTWFLWFRLNHWRKSVLGEALDAEHKLKTEFDALITRIHGHVSDMKEIRKSKLTKAEESVFMSIEEELRDAQGRLKKEIADIETIVQ